VTPLLLREQPAVALPYAQQALARRLAAAPALALLVSDDRMTGSGWQPVAVTGRPRLLADRDGKLFTDQLLEQELRKYPPSRALADSVLLRREHWWYLPRLIVTLEPDSVTAVGARAGGQGEVLAVVDEAGQLAVDTVRGDDEVAGQRRLTSLHGRDLPSGAAVLLGHDFSVPDLERWTPWHSRGWLAGAHLTVEQRPERTSLEPPPGLWRRLRRQQQLERACRRALAG
jgi:hypothetical protein